MQTARNYLLRGPSYTALKSPLAAMQNFATFEWLLWQQGLIGVNLNNTVRLPDPEKKAVGKHNTQLSFTGTKLYRFKISIGRNANLLKIRVE